MLFIPKKAVDVILKTGEKIMSICKTIGTAIADNPRVAKGIIGGAAGVIISQIPGKVWERVFENSKISIAPIETPPKPASVPNPVSNEKHTDIGNESEIDYWTFRDRNEQRAHEERMLEMRLRAGLTNTDSTVE